MCSCVVTSSFRGQRVGGFLTLVCSRRVEANSDCSRQAGSRVGSCDVAALVGSPVDANPGVSPMDA